MRGVSALQKLGLPQFAMKLSRVARPRKKEGSLVSASAPQGQAARGRHGRAEEGPTKPPLPSPRAGGLGLPRETEERGHSVRANTRGGLESRSLPPVSRLGGQANRQGWAYL